MLSRLLLLPAAQGDAGWCHCGYDGALRVMIARLRRLLVILQCGVEKLHLHERVERGALWLWPATNCRLMPLPLPLAEDGRVLPINRYVWLQGVALGQVPLSLLARLAAGLLGAQRPRLMSTLVSALATTANGDVCDQRLQLPERALRLTCAVGDDWDLNVDDVVAHEGRLAALLVDV